METDLPWDEWAKKALGRLVAIGLILFGLALLPTNISNQDSPTPTRTPTARTTPTVPATRRAIEGITPPANSQGRIQFSP